MKCYYCNKKVEQAENIDNKMKVHVFICDECLATKKNQIQKDFPQAYERKEFEGLKTIQDLEEMKNTPTTIFSNAYEFFLESLENNLISKQNGEQRNELLLSKYNEEAQQQVLVDLQKKIDLR